MSLAGKKGVDISATNGNVDIQKIKDAGYEFVMIRCGYGNNDTNQDDSQFENNVRKCEAIGMPWGVYLYSYALNTDEAKSEAQHVLRLLKGKKPLLPVAFDMEDGDGYKRKNGMPSNATLRAICKTFLSTTSKAGYYSSLYANVSWLENQLNDSSLLNSYDVWVAQWNSKCQYGGKYGMWQYGGETNYLESNSIPGVGVIDKDYAYKDYPTVIKKGGWNGWKAEQEEQHDNDGKDTVMSYDNSNLSVLLLKQMLLILNWRHIINSSVADDDGFGGGTLEAVKEVQALANLPQDGLPGPQTIRFMKKLIEDYYLTVFAKIDKAKETLK